MIDTRIIELLEKLESIRKDKQVYCTLEVKMHSTRDYCVYGLYVENFIHKDYETIDECLKALEEITNKDENFQRLLDGESIEGYEVQARTDKAIVVAFDGEQYLYDGETCQCL